MRPISCDFLVKLDDSLSVLEENMAQRLSKIESRLESLEAVVSHIDLLQNSLLFIIGITCWSQRFSESWKSLEKACKERKTTRPESHFPPHPSQTHELNFRYEVENITYNGFLSLFEISAKMKKLKGVRYKFSIITFQLGPYMLSLFLSSVDACFYARLF